MTTSRPPRSTTSSRTTSRREFYDRDGDGLPQGWIAMMTHTLKTLGPKVLASRMVAGLHRAALQPRRRRGPRRSAARSSPAPRTLAAYKARVRDAWPRVKVEHVEPSGVSDSPQIGDDARRARLRRPRRPDSRRRRGAARRTATSTTSTSCAGVEVAPLALRRVGYDDGRTSSPGRPAAATHRLVRLQRARRAEAPDARRRRPSSAWRAPPEA